MVPFGVCLYVCNCENLTLTNAIVAHLNSDRSGNKQIGIEFLDVYFFKEPLFLNTHVK